MRGRRHFLVVHLVHNALPEIDMGDVDLTTDFLEKELLAPIIVDSMTGGAPRAEEINGVLAEVAESMGFAWGSGARRGAPLGRHGPDLLDRAKKAPTAFIFANIGGAQLAKGLTAADAEKLIEMIDADALAIHLNPLQEVVQPEGEASFRGVLEKIRDLCREVSVPVIVKEVGAGISGDVAARLETAGAKAVNVSGAGGTSWAGIEAIRAGSRKMEGKARLGALFWDWGVPTAAALIDTRKAVRIQVIASGGLRNGLELAKCLSLGADVCGIARPMLEHAALGRDDLERFARQLLEELRVAMFITGSGTVADLRKVRKVITPPLNYWEA